MRISGDLRIMSVSAASEVEIWSSVICPEGQSLSSEDAESILRWRFDAQAKERMESLMELNNNDELSETEREELESYLRVGQVISVLQAKAALRLRELTSVNQA